MPSWCEGRSQTLELRVKSFTECRKSKGRPGKEFDEEVSLLKCHTSHVRISLQELMQKCPRMMSA